jgi:hypothetical protein
MVGYGLLVGLLLQWVSAVEIGVCDRSRRCTLMHADVGGWSRCFGM